MVNAWGGADPSAFSEPGVDYELGARYLVTGDITVTAMRVYSGVVSANFANRNAYIRTTTDTILATVDMPDVLAIGWNTVNLTVPLNISPGTTVWATYDTITDYVVIANAFPQNSSDGAVTANSGGFNNTPGSLPNNLTTTFYGVDFVYTVINHFPPTVTASASVNGLTATVNLAIADDHPETVTYKIEWGDGASANVSSLGPHVHTYTTAGVYAFLVTATDADANVDAFALPLSLISATAGTAVAVRDAIGAYLVGPYSAARRAFMPLIIGAPPISGLNMARRSWDKDDDRADFTRDAPAGTKSGALAIIQLAAGEERRASVPIGTGRKRAAYRLQLHVYVASTEPYAEDAQDWAYALRDAIFARIRADPTCASGGFELGGFQIGEGGDPWLRWSMPPPETNAQLTRIYMLIEAEAHQYIIA